MPSAMWMRAKLLIDVSVLAVVIGCGVHHSKTSQVSTTEMFGNKTSNKSVHYGFVNVCCYILCNKN